MSDAGLARYAVRPPTIVREPARDSQKIPVCAECGHPAPQTKGPQRIHNPDVVDRDLRQHLNRPLITFGYRCNQHAYEVVTPNRCDSSASAMLDRWTGVEVAFCDEHERFVPTPEKEMVVLEAGGERADV